MRKTALCLLWAVGAAAILPACSPRFDWRDYRSPDAHYSVLFPGKPANLTRTVVLDGMKVSMKMTAAEVDDTTFAVGSARMADPAKAQAALLAMRTAMLNNIGASVKSEKAVFTPSATDGAASRSPSVEIEALGMQDGKPMLLTGRFVARGTHVYQVIVLGPEKSSARDNVETFMSSFKLDE